MDTHGHRRGAAETRFWPARRTLPVPDNAGADDVEDRATGVGRYLTGTMANPTAPSSGLVTPISISAIRIVTA